MADDKMTITDQEALDFHTQGQPGKIAILPTKPLKTQRDLSLAYSPGVAVPCLKIHEEGFSLCFRSHQMLIALLRSRHGFRTVPCDVRELLDLGK